MIFKKILTPFASALSIVSLVLAHSLHGASVNLGWGLAPAPVVGYTVSYGILPGTYTAFYDASSNLTATISDLVPGISYYLAVNSYDSTGVSSAYSPEIIYTVPLAGTNGSPTNLSGLQITSDPTSVSVVSGGSASLTVGVSGGLLGLYLYQWYFNGTPILGAVGQTLNLPNITAATAGEYYVVVNSGLSVVTSGAANVTVYVPPTITASYAAITTYVGANLRLRSAPSGSGPFTWQWYHNGLSMPGQTNVRMVVSNISYSDAGQYSVTVQNMAGVATATLADITVVSPYMLVAGTYNGLFYQTNAASPNVTVPTSGMIGNCLVMTNGAYTAKLLQGGMNFLVTGTFSATGDDVEVISRASQGLADLTVAMHMDISGTSHLITGTISNMDANNPWVASLMADLATNALPVPAGVAMLPLVRVGATLLSPHGNATLLISPQGTVSVAGMMFDGTQFSQSVPVSADGLIPLYASLYGGNGIVTGWISLATGSPVGTVTWIRPSGAISPIPYPRGFTNVYHLN